METIYTVRNFDIELKNFSDYVNIWFWGDVHRDAKSCDEERWKKFLARAAADDPDKTYYFGLGDYNDFASDREQTKLMKEGYGLHETTMENIHELVEKRNRSFAQEIKQMRGKLIGLVDGNHNWRFPNGVTASEDLSNRMGCHHLGWLTHTTINFSICGKRKPFDIVACHGKGGGKRAGASVNHVEDLTDIFPAADLYVMGHDHKLWAYPKDILIRVNGDIKQKTQYLCRSGSFKKAYMPEKAGYEIGRLLKPATLGALKIRVSFNRDQRKKQDRITTNIEATV